MRKHKYFIGMILGVIAIAIFFLAQGVVSKKETAVSAPAFLEELPTRRVSRVMILSNVLGIGTYNIWVEMDNGRYEKIPEIGFKVLENPIAKDPYSCRVFLSGVSEVTLLVPAEGFEACKMPKPNRTA